MKDRLKVLNEISEAPEKKLKSVLPKDYINKNIFRVAVGIMLLLAFYGAYKLDFDFKNYYVVSCKATEPMPCLNPFYFCLHKTEVSIINYSQISNYETDIVASGCDGLDLTKICSQGVCDQKYLEPGTHLGKQKPNINWISWVSIGILLIAFTINHSVWLIKRGK